MRGESQAHRDRWLRVATRLDAWCLRANRCLPSVPCQRRTFQTRDRTDASGRSSRHPRHPIRRIVALRNALRASARPSSSLGTEWSAGCTLVRRLRERSAARGRQFLPTFRRELLQRGPAVQQRMMKRHRTGRRVQQSREGAPCPRGSPRRAQFARASSPNRCTPRGSVNGTKARVTAPRAAHRSATCSPGVSHPPPSAL